MDQQIKLHTETVVDCAHFLKGYDGLCANTHGHSVRIRVWVKGNASILDELGILFDFTQIKKIKDEYDHKLLNDCYPFRRGSKLVQNPTAENIAITIYKILKSENPLLDFVVRVYETSIGKETWAQTGDWDEQSG